MVELMCPGCRTTLTSGQPYCPDCLLTPVPRPPADDSEAPAEPTELVSTAAAPTPAPAQAPTSAAAQAPAPGPACGDPDCAHGGVVPAEGCRHCGSRPRTGPVAGSVAGSAAGSVAGSAADRAVTDAAPVVLLFPWGAVSLAAGRTLRVGRENSPLATELASYSNVSRRHAEISADGRGLFVTDLESANGTFVNDRRVTPGEPFRVGPGDQLRFASTLVVRVEGGGAR